MRQEVQQGMALLQTFAEKLIEFLINYGFEVLGALLVLLLGFKSSASSPTWGSGVSLRLFRPFAVGDTIQVARVSGIVEEVKPCSKPSSKPASRSHFPNGRCTWSPATLTTHACAVPAVDGVVLVGVDLR